MSRSKLLPSFVAALVSALLSVAGAQPIPKPAKPKPGRLLVVFQEGTSMSERKNILAQLGLRAVDHLETVEICVVKKPVTGQAALVSRALKNPKVVSIEEDYYTNWLKLDDGAAPSIETAFAGARGVLASAPKLAQPAGEAPWGVARVGAPGVWRKDRPSSMGAGVKVAVVDTGISCGHPDLQCDSSSGYNALDPQSPPDDDNGHGTHVAGTIAARWDGQGVVGVAPGATLIPVKVLDKDGGGALSDVVRGINWAAEHGVDVINMSLGSPKGSKSLEQAVRKAYERGVTIVAAAGNEGPDPDTVGYPGAYPQVIAVAASDKQDGIADFSSRGPQVAFTAPGVDILSTVPGGGYEMMSGTSMASPHMSGLAALAVADGARGPDAVRAALSRGAKRLCHVEVCPSAELQGAGLVEAPRLLSGGASGTLFVAGGK